MTGFACRRGQRPGLYFALAFSLSAASVPAVLKLASADELVATSMADKAVMVHLDQARTLKLPERTATLVVGNPLIADAVVQPGGIVVITAKSYGATNLVALDRSGNTLFDRPVQVVGPADAVVVVYRGVDRESYSCMPKCERRITIGDTPGYFTANLNQIGTFSAQANGGQAPR